MQIDECPAIRGGRLHVERCDAGGLAERFGTPLYVVDGTVVGLVQRPRR